MPWGAWWVGTWITGVLAGSIVLAALHAPSRPDDAGPLGAVLDPPIGVLAASLLALWGVYLAGMRLATDRVGTGSFRADYGVAFAPVDLVGLPVGVAAQLVLVPAVYAPLRAIWPDTFTAERLEDTARDLVERADGGLLVVLVALVVVGAPVVEELFFRGFLQRPLLAVAGSPGRRLAVVVFVAFVFAAIHFRPVELPGLFVAGLAFGVGAWRSGRIGMAVGAHVAFNATGIVAVL